MESDNSQSYSGIKSEDECNESWLEEFVNLQEEISIKACDSTFPAIESSDWSQKSYQWNIVTPEILENSKEDTQNDMKPKINKQNLHPIHIEKRNARERKRVKDVNAAFSKLRQVVPSVASHSKHVSKVKTLKKAVEYITQLKHVLDHTQPVGIGERSNIEDLNKS